MKAALLTAAADPGVSAKPLIIRDPQSSNVIKKRKKPAVVSPVKSPKTDIDSAPLLEGSLVQALLMPLTVV